MKTLPETFTANNPDGSIIQIEFTERRWREGSSVKSEMTGEIIGHGWGNWHPLTDEDEAYYVAKYNIQHQA